MDDRGRGNSLDKCLIWEKESPTSKAFFCIWYDCRHRERKEVFIRGISGTGSGHLMSDLTGADKRISSRAYLLPSTHRDDACSQLLAMTSYTLLVPRRSPLGVPARLRIGINRVGLGLSMWCTNNYSHTTLSWCMTPQSWVLCLSLYLCFVPPVINSEVLFAKPASCSVPDVFNGLSGPQTALKYRGPIDLQWLIDSSAEGWLYPRKERMVTSLHI